MNHDAMPTPRTPGSIPVGDARRIARDHQCPLVVIFALDAGGESFTITTYGQTKKFCRLAADFGKQFAAAIFDGTVAPSLIEPLDLPDTPALWRKEGTP